MDYTIEQVEQRMSEIKNEIETADEERLAELEIEIKALNDRKEELRNIAEEERETRAKAAEEGITVKTFETEERTKNNMEIRNTPEYVKAFADYIRTEDDRECRALLTENVSGALPVPEFVYEEIKQAWENDELFSRVRKISVKGNMKVGFERSADGAVIHTEGTSAPSEESLTLGIVTMIPQSIKKWITVSDEAIDMDPEAFLRYVYDELTYQIIKKAKDTLITQIAAASTSASSSAVNVPKITKAAGVDTVITALGNLSDQAQRPVAVMNKATWAAIRAAANTAYYGVDPFEGLDVVFANILPAYATASTNDVYMIVGDFEYGALANLPNGEEVRIKYDDLSLAEADLVKIVGRMFVALGVVGPAAFCNVAKPSA